MAMTFYSKFAIKPMDKAEGGDRNETNKGRALSQSTNTILLSSNNRVRMLGWGKL